MKAKWIIASAGVLVIAGAMPWVTGYVTEQHWQQVTHELNESQPFIHMQTDGYHRGYFGSDLAGFVEVLNPDNGETQRIEYLADVTHGITGSFIEFIPVGGWEPEGADWFDERPRLTLETRLWGTAVLELEVPAIDINHPVSAESLRTSGGVARIEISDAGARAETLVVWPQISFSGPDLSIRINNFRVEQQMVHLVEGVWTGAMDASIASVALNPADGKQVTIEGLLASSRTEAKDNGQRLDSRLEVAANKLQFDDQSYGPQKIEFALEGLEVSSWSQLTSSMTELQGIALAPGAGDREVFQQQMAAIEQVNRAVRDLAAAGVTVGFPELSLSTPQGVVDGNLVISHPQLTEDEKENMLMVMQRLTGDMNLSIPTVLVDEYPPVRMQLAPLVKQGLLVPEGDHLVLAAKLKEMMVEVNGQEFPLPPLL